MSTLEVACTRCDRRFRVRAEFAGRSTRCPGCSAPITVGGSPSPPPPSRSEPEERPRARPRPRDPDDEPRRPAGDWAPVDVAFRREQFAVVFLLIGIVLDYLMFCVVQSAGRDGGEALLAMVLIVVSAPLLTAGAFGILARLSAMKAPTESLSRGTATASLLCGLGALACLLILAITFLMTLDAHRPVEGPMVVAIVGTAIAILGAVGTFLGFTAQVAIVRRSAAISRGIGRTAVAAAGCVLGLIGIGVLYALGSEVLAPPTRGFGAVFRRHAVFYQIALSILFPLALAIVLVFYHRLLAAGRQALQGESAGRYDG